MTNLLRRWAIIVLALACCAGASAADWKAPLADGLDGPDFSPAGGLYYRDNFEQSAGSFAFQNEVKLEGAGALKLSVDPLCKDDDACSERAEIWEKTALRVPYDEGVWYGFATRFGEPIPTDDHRYLIAQWKREIDPGAEGDFSPFLALRLRNGKLFATVETNYVAPPANAPRVSSDGRCPAGWTPVWLRPETNQMRALVATDPKWTAADNDLYQDCTDAIAVLDHGNSLPAPSGEWISFMIYTRPDPDGCGRIEIVANGRPVVTVTGRIGHGDEGLGQHQYFKFGPYRAGHSDRWTMYYDDFWRSPLPRDGTATPVAAAATGGAAGPSCGSMTAN